MFLRSAMALQELLSLITLTLRSGHHFMLGFQCTVYNIHTPNLTFYYEEYKLQNKHFIFGW